MDKGVECLSSVLLWMFSSGDPLNWLPFPKGNTEKGESSLVVKRHTFLHMSQPNTRYSETSHGVRWCKSWEEMSGEAFLEPLLSPTAGVDTKEAGGDSGSKW
jgi:hypothetical protein